MYGRGHEALRCSHSTQERYFGVFRRRTCASCSGSESFSGKEGAEYWLKEGTAIVRIISHDIKELLTRLSEPEVRSVESLITGGALRRLLTLALSEIRLRESGWERGEQDEGNNFGFDVKMGRVVEKEYLVSADFKFS